MSWISNVLKPKKANLTPDVQQPSQEDLFHTSKLRDVVSRGLNGEGLGFGNDFVNRQSSPGIAQIDANFRDRTLPTLSNEASKRGLARSSIVTDQIGRADQQRNRDVQETVARFQYLNELQGKQDYTQVLNQANTMQGQQAALLGNRASASERLTDKTAAQQNQRQADNQKMLGSMIESGAPLVASSVGAVGGGIEALLQKAGLGNVAQSLRPAGEAIQSGLKGVSANVLSTMSDDDLDQMIAKYLQSRGQ